MNKVLIIILFLFAFDIYAQKVLQLEKKNKHHRCKYIKEGENVLYTLKDSSYMFIGAITRITDSLIYINENPIKPANISMICLRKEGRKEFRKSLVTYGITLMLIGTTLQRDPGVLYLSQNAVNAIGAIAIVGLSAGTYYFYKGVWEAVNPRRFYAVNWEMSIVPAPCKGLKYFFRGII